MLTDLIEAVREQCVFTTHTPVPAGHDQFPEELAQRVLGDHRRSTLMKACGIEQRLNLTQLALRLARYVNGVAMKHGEVSHGMFPDYPIDAITNGVHAVTWTLRRFSSSSIPISGLAARQLSLRYAVGIPTSEIRAAHAEAKRTIVEHVNRESNVGFDRDIFTIGFARRFAAYKRADLIFRTLTGSRRSSARPDRSRSSLAARRIRTTEAARI